MDEPAYHRLGRTGAPEWWRGPLSLVGALLALLLIAIALLVPAVVLSLLFSATHGLDQPLIEVVDIAWFGLVAAWLTIRTGGLEAAIALHAASNVAGFTLTAAEGELAVYLLSDAEPPLEVAAALVDMALVTLVAVVLVRRFPAASVTVTATR